MKALIALLTITAAAVSANAFGLESHYGNAVRQGHSVVCQYTNTTANTQDMKYVVFQFETLGHGGNEVTTQIRIDKTVAPGASLAVKTDMGFAVKANLCKYLAR